MGRRHAHRLVLIAVDDEQRLLQLAAHVVRNIEARAVGVVVLHNLVVHGQFHAGAGVGHVQHAHTLPLIKHCLGPLRMNFGDGGPRSHGPDARVFGGFQQGQAAAPAVPGQKKMLQIHFGGRHGRSTGRKKCVDDLANVIELNTEIIMPKSLQIFQITGAAHH